MIKSDKEMKNNGIHLIKASFQVPHLRISFEDWESCLREKISPWKDSNPGHK